MIRHTNFIRQSLLLAGLLVGSVPGRAQVAERVMHPTITVSDLNRVLPFYTQVLSFDLIGTRTVAAAVAARLFSLPDSTHSVRVATLRLGQETLELLDFVGPETGRSMPPDSRSNDRWFQHIAIVVSDIDKAYRQLRQHRVGHVSTAPQTLPAYLPAAAGIRAFYFHDPDGHVLELIWFPPGKGNPRWQPPAAGQQDGALFLGIDHTAVASADTDRSLAFYRDGLGLQLGGTSENYGTEQEHLNQVFGAHLLISGLTTGRGMGIELLDYLAPPGGRPYPEASRANDLWHWHTVLKVSGLAAFRDRLHQQGYPLLSPGIVSLDGLGLAARRGLWLRDPDGHALLLCE